MDGKVCNRCGEWRAASGWHPSTLLKSGRWCKACMRSYYRNKNTPKGGVDDAPRPCRWCGTQYSPKIRSESFFCSRACKGEHRNQEEADLRLAAKTTRACVHCGADIPPKMRRDAKFCSAHCNDRAHRLQRKLRVRGGGSTGFLRMEVAERDKYRCGICGRRVDMTILHPDPLTGSLDHVLPVSEGGTSDVANLRLTHLVCNLRRRDRGGNEQLALL